MKSVTSILSMATILVISAAAQAAPLIVETFDYSVGALAGNNGGTGFSAAWGETIPSGLTDGGIDVTSGSIAFSDYATTGNKATLEWNAGSTTSTQYLYATRQVSVGLSTGDMWISYLYQHTDGANDSTSRTAEVKFDDGANHFGSQIKASNTNGIKVRYDASTGATADSVNIQDGSAYLAIVKYAELGGDTSAASFWVLSAAGYDSIKSGGIDESELDAAAVLKATDTTSTAEVLTANLDTLYLLNGTKSYPSTFDIDEFRLGTSLSDVVAVPEPASAVLAVFGLSLITIRRH